MPAARKPITAYAVLTGSGAPKLTMNPPLALIWLASHCAPRCARWALVAVSAAAVVAGAATSDALVAKMAVTTSARSPRRALKSDPMGSSFRNRPARRHPREPFRNNAPCAFAQGASIRAGTPGLRPVQPRRFVWSPPPGRHSGSLAQLPRFGRTYGCGSAPAFDRLPPHGNVGREHIAARDSRPARVS